MQQIIVIHGGTTFASYDLYLEDLKTKPLHPERFIYQPMWKERLRSDLGEDYQVLLPSMPNKTNARYNEWKLWFDRITEVMNDDAILIGHSLGAIFLAKYLNEERLPHTPKAVIFVAAPHSDESSESLTDFKITAPLLTLAETPVPLVFFFGSDDPVIPLTEMERYKADLPAATYHVVSAPDHFVRPIFPDLVKTILSLS